MQHLTFKIKHVDNSEKVVVSILQKERWPMFIFVVSFNLLISLFILFVVLFFIL